MSLPDIPRFLTAIAESLAVLVIALNTRNLRRYVPIKFIVMALGQIILQTIVGTWSLSFWFLGMATNIAWMYLSFIVICQDKLNLRLYHSMKAFMFAEFLASFGWLLSFYLFPGKHETILNQQYIATLVIYIIVCILYYVFLQRTSNNRVPISRRTLLSTFISCVIIFLVSNLGFFLSSTIYTLGDRSTIFMFRTMIDVLGLALMYIQEGQRQQIYLQDEIQAINNALYYQYRQYTDFRHASSQIDRKVHDLKHQLQLLSLEMTDNTYRKQIVEDIENLIRQYDTNITTNNPLLDPVLSQKNLVCLQNNIAFSCMVDGKELDFMNALDLYSILGNALDNAIESTLKLDEEKRVINLRIYRKNQFTLIRIENPYAGTINYEDGLPQTTKKDTHYHGYGIKSMSYIVEKYNGNLTFDTKDNWFTLTMMFNRDNLVKANKSS